MPAVVVANWLDINDISAGTQTNDIKVTLDNETVDVSDRAARLLGKVYGSQSQPLTQTATNYNLQTEIAVGGTLVDPRAIRALTSSDVVDISDRAARDLGKVDIAAFDVQLPTGTNRLGKIQLVGSNDIALDVLKDTARPANTKAFLIAGVDLGDIVRFPTITLDSGDGKSRIEVAGKFSLGNPSPPSTATAKTVAADTPLDVGSTDDEDYEITDGTTFTVTQVFAGSEGDPNEKGSVVEVFYIDASSVSHIVERVYITGFTRDIYPDTSIARDGTSMDGTAAGGTGVLRIRRRRLGGAAIEIDAVVRGYEE